MRLRFLDKHKPICLYRFFATILAYTAFGLAVIHLLTGILFGLSE